MSVNILYLSISVLVSLYLVTRPMATPAADEDIGTLASSSAKLPPQTVAIEEEPVFIRQSIDLKFSMPLLRPRYKYFLITANLN